MPATNKEPELQINRREFLQLTAGSSIAATIFRRPIPEILSADHPTPSREWNTGKEEFLVSTCGFCLNSCSLLCRLVDGKLVRLEGNPLSPINRHSLCSAGVAAVQHIYHPDRILYPMKRTGVKGTTEFTRITWDDAIQSINEHVQSASAEPKIRWVDDGTSGPLTQNYLLHLLEKIGKVEWVESTPTPMRMLLQEVQKVDHIEYDIENAQTILSFGYPLLEGGRYPICTMRIFGRRISQNPFHLIQVESRYSITAAKAQDWIPLLPTKEGALALAVAYSLVREEWYDASFVSQYSSDFSEFRQWLLRTLTLEELSEACGVSTEIVLSIARKIAQNPPSVAIFDEEIFYREKGFLDAWAIYLINALLGNIGKPGGTLVPFPHPFATPPPSIPLSALQFVPTPPIVIIGEKDLSFSPEFSSFFSWLEKAPFVVQCTSLLNDTSVYADLILPVASFLECYRETYLTPFGKQIITVSSPVISPQEESLPLYEIVWKIASASQSLQAIDDFPTHLNFQLRQLYSLGRGIPFGTEEEILSIRSMQERGWWYPEEPDEDVYAEQIWKRGGWLDPLPPYHQMRWHLRQPFSFFPPSVQNVLFSDTGKDHFLKKNEKAGTYLLLHAPLALRPAHNHLPWLLEHPSPDVEFSWFPWAEISPEDAEMLEIKDGEMVELEFARGTVALRIIVSPRIPKGTISVPQGFGQKQKGRYSAKKGTNLYSHLNQAYDVVTGLPAIGSTKVTLRKRRK